MSTNVIYWALKAADAQGWKPSHADCLATWEPQLPETAGPVKVCKLIAFTYFVSDKESDCVPADERLFLLVIYNLRDILNYFPQTCHCKLKLYEALKCGAYVQIGKR